MDANVDRKRKRKREGKKRKAIETLGSAPVGHLCIISPLCAETPSHSSAAPDTLFNTLLVFVLVCENDKLSKNVAASKNSI